ncbi:FtsX-like permease family protein [Rhizomonospora bruguierae]|uniref:FtsX-like permease family protein n=1 Tax=Rhizomonospora bruguierae TaxID=1581705 RepID=UPI001BCB3FA5|nr:FtsX-like permease family protein [Micromonospora sp. NBRC 107566]
MLRVARLLPDNLRLPAPLLLDRVTVRGHDPAALTELVYASTVVTPPAGLGVRLVDVPSYARGADAEEDRLVRIFVLVLIGMSVGYTLLAVVNTLLMATVDRRREFAVLRLAGATRRQILRAVAAESAVVVAVGALLGLGVAVVALLGVRAGVAQHVQAPVDLILPVGPNAAVVAACLVLALAASVLPALRTAGSR